VAVEDELFVALEIKRGGLELIAGEINALMHAIHETRKDHPAWTDIRILKRHHIQFRPILLKLGDVGLEEKHVQVIQRVEKAIQEPGRHFLVEGTLCIMIMLQVGRGNLGDDGVVRVRSRCHFGNRPWLWWRRAMRFGENVEKNKGRGQAPGCEQESKSH
jgi:hypothetical protein